jgi:hypothetical protein
VPEMVELSEPVTRPLPTPSAATDAALEPEPRRARFWRELSGALAVGMAVLAGVVLVFQILAWIRDMSGPGGRMVIGHLVAAGLVVGAQLFADRRTGWAAGVALGGAAAVAAATLWLYWWA